MSAPEEPRADPAQLTGVVGRTPRQRDLVTLRCAMAAASFTIALGVVARGLAERTWWSTFAAYMPTAAHLVLPLAALALALFRRHRVAALISILSLALAAGPIAGGKLPDPRRASQGGLRVRVLSWNILGAESGFAPLRAEIERCRPDIVSFSESRGWSREQELAGELAETFRGWSVRNAGDVFLATRFPTIASGQVPLGSPTGAVSFPLDRPMAWIRFRLGDTECRVGGIHFYLGQTGLPRPSSLHEVPQYGRSIAAVRYAQSQVVAGWMAADPAPSLVTGDFNTPPFGRCHELLTAHAQDAFEVAGSGWGFSFPTVFPVWRIDWVLATPHWRVLTCETGRARGSDHLPVFAELELR